MNFQSFIYSIQTGQTNACLSLMSPDYVNVIYDTVNRKRPIHLACEYGNLEIVKGLRQSQCDLNVVTADKSHSLHIGCKYGHYKVVKFLIDNKCDVERRNMNQERPIHLACQFGWVKVVKLLIDNYCSLNSKTLAKWTPLHYAACFGHNATVTLLLNQGSSRMEKTTDGYTALDIAKLNNRHSTVMILEQYQAVTYADANSSLSSSQSILCESHSKDNAITVEETDKDWKSILSAVEELDIGKFKASYNPKYLSRKDDKTGLGLLDSLIQTSSHEMIDFVLDHDIDHDILISSEIYREHGERIINHYNLYRAIRTRDEDRWTLWAKISTINESFIMTGNSFLEISAQYGGMAFTRMVYEATLERGESWSRAKELSTRLQKLDVHRLIEEREMMLDNRDLIHWNRLHVAVHDNRNDVVQHILSDKAIDPSLMDSNLNTPFDIALFLGHIECSKSLLKSIPDINVKNKFGQTKLHLIIDSSINSLVDDVLARTPDLSQKDMLKLNPLMSAIAHGNKEICQKILDKKKNILSEYLRFDKSVLESLCQQQNTNPIPLTLKETYFTFCMKMNGDLFDSLKSRLDKSNISITDGNNNSLLHISSSLGNLDLSSAVVKIVGTNTVRAKNQEGNTPLHLLLKRITETKDLLDNELVDGFLKLFLKSGADLGLKNSACQSVIDLSLNLGDERIFHKLIIYSTKVHLTEVHILEILNRNWISIFDNYISSIDNHTFSQLVTESILLSVFERCSMEIITKVISVASKSVIDAVREELLVLAAEKELHDIFILLLHNYEVKIKTLIDGETLLTSLLKAEKYEYCKNLLSADREKMTSSDIEILVDQVNMKGQTALHAVAYLCRNTGLLEQMLLESMAWDKVDDEGNTVLGILLGKVDGMVEANNIKEFEKIIKIIVRGGQDLYQLGKDGKPIIEKCKNLGFRKKLERLRKPENLFVGETEKNICQICLHREVNCVLQCGHPFCKECVSQLTLCPACRQTIETYQPLYI